MNRTLRIGLALLSGVMLGLAYPPSQAGILACFALVPLLILLADIPGTGQGLRYTYLAMLPFHAITLAWTGGYSHGNDPYMMIAGSLTILIHPLFYLLPVWAYQVVKRNLGGVPALVAFPFLWLSYEYSHTLSEWSFPWLTIGNTQTYDLARMQIASVTGVWGLSLWVLLVNVLAFVLYSRLARILHFRGDARSWGLVALIVVVVAAPRIYGEAILRAAGPHAPGSANGAISRDQRISGNGTIRVGIIQSNIDPWDKWSQGANGYGAIRTYLSMTDSLKQREGKLDLVLWPETAVPFYLLIDRNQFLLHDVRSQIDAIGVPVLTGLPHAVFFPDSLTAPPSAKRWRQSGERYYSYNAAALIQPGDSLIPWYGKMKMVPLAERIPYAEIFAFLDPLRWNVGLGGWNIGPDTTIFALRKTGTRFATLICYESVYPDFVAGFVRKGAEVLTIITIDSWWGRMSGAFQHQQYALLRAIENRRWVVRCAVGGISSVIDPYGRVVHSTDLFTRTSFAHDIAVSTELSPYSRHGDWLPQIGVMLSGLFLAGAAGRRFLQRKRRDQWQNT